MALNAPQRNSPTTANDGPLKIMHTPRFTTGKTDQYTIAASEMACVHNFIIRGFNSIYLQAPNVKPKDYKDFIGYSLAWYDCLHSHHEGEETMFFPLLEKMTGEKGIMDANISQHEAFHAGLQAFYDYLSALVKEGKQAEFAAEKLMVIMDSFKDVLVKHLDDEIPTILALSRFGDKLDLIALMEKEGKEVMGGLSKTGALPFCFLSHDTTFEGGLYASWPPVPAPVRFMFCHIMTKWNAGWWKFAPCDASGKPNALYCA